MEKNLKANVEEIAAEIIQAADVLRSLVDGKLADVLKIVEALKEEEYDGDTFDPEVRTAQILLRSVMSIASTVAQSSTCSYESQVRDVVARAEYNGFAVAREEA